MDKMTDCIPGGAAKPIRGVASASQDGSNLNDIEGNKLFRCSHCEETFSRKANLKRHHQRRHKDAPMEDNSSVSRSQCLYPHCERLFYHKSKMMTHMEEEHEVQSACSLHSFSSEKEFLDWKEKEEMTNCVYFSKQRGDKEGKSTKYSYYICQQDGSEHPHRAQDEPARKTDRKNSKGQVKTGTICPARMSVHTDTETGKIGVKYMRTHSHEPTFKDTEHHPIPKSIRTEIESKIALGIPVTQIRRDLRGGLGERENRSDSTSTGQLRAYQFVSKRIMHEMHRKLNANTRLHPRDNMSTYLLIKKLANEKYNPILLYKSQGDAIFIGDPAVEKLPHAKELFAVGIQTNEQLQMMNNRQILCIDATHGTNQYGYSLTNLLVPDEWGKGYPVGHLISNYTDEKTMYYFFNEIKRRSPNLVVNAIMSDDDYSGPNAIKAVFGESIRHLLCKWHVHRSWQRKLKHHIPTDTALREEVYKCLVVILEEKNSNKFKELTEAFEKKYTNKCESFVKYFFSNYMNRVEVWAMCHRQFPHAKTDTNMFAEAFHNRLKTFFLKRKPNRRVDDLINLLLEIEEEDFWRRRSDLQYKSSIPQLSIPKESRHKNGLRIEDKDVEHVETRVWRVRSQSKNNDIWYTVTSVEQGCDQGHCFEKCLELSCLGLCSHMYHCSCDDNSLLCKHIHKIHAFRLRVDKSNRKNETQCYDTEDSSYGIPLTTTTLLPDLEDVLEPTPPKRMLEATKGDLSKLQELLQNEEVVAALLPYISGTLKRLLSQCLAVVSSKSTPQPQPMELTKKIAPNAKLQLQLQPMKKALTRKAAPPTFTGPTAAERRDLMKSLLQDRTGSECDESSGKDFTPPAVKKSKLSLRRKRRAPADTEEDRETKQPDEEPAQPTPVRVKSCSSSAIPDVRFTPQLSATRNPMETLIRNGPHCLTLLEILSLEPTLSREEEMTLKALDKDFRSGWLYDTVIDSFFWRLQENPRVLYASSTTMRAILHGCSTRKLWADERIQGKDFVFIPWNSTGNHWVLFALDVARNVLMYLDPLVSGNDEISISQGTMEAADRLSDVFKTKFSVDHPTLEQPAKSLQRDGSSCGVFVCFYGHQLVNKKPLTDQLLTAPFRQYVYRQILGNCKITSTERDSCGICMDDLNVREWVSCSRCQQWYHCQCVGISYDDATSIADYFCN